MKAKQEQQLPESNPLADLHIIGMKLLPRVRKAVCRVLNWSVPTYYRKMRGTIAESDIAKIVPVIRAYMKALDATFTKYQKNDDPTGNSRID